jgi:hypothetical protein
VLRRSYLLQYQSLALHLRRSEKSFQNIKLGKRGKPPPQIKIRTKTKTRIRTRRKEKERLNLNLYRPLQRWRLVLPYLLIGNLHYTDRSLICVDRRLEGRIWGQKPRKYQRVSRLPARYTLEFWVFAGFRSSSGGARAGKGIR